MNVVIRLLLLILVSAGCSAVASGGISAASSAVSVVGGSLLGAVRIDCSDDEAIAAVARRSYAELLQTGKTLEVQCLPGTDSGGIVNPGSAK